MRALVLVLIVSFISFSSLLAQGEYEKDVKYIVEKHDGNKLIGFNFV